MKLNVFHKEQPTTNRQPYLQEIPISQLNVDNTDTDGYQRETDPKHAQNIADNMWEPALGVLYVNQRPDGSYWVMEGGHRKMSILLWSEDEHYPALCLVYHLPQQEEARFFALMDGRKRLSGLATYDASLVSGDRVTCRLTEVLGEHGFAIAPKGVRSAKKKALNHFLQPKVLKSILNEYGRDSFALALRLIKLAWSNDPEATSTDIIRGCVYLCRDLDTSCIPAIARKLSRETCQDLRDKAKASSKRNGYLKAADVANALRAALND
jgi:hypothetical protein